MDPSRGRRTRPSVRTLLFDGVLALVVGALCVGFVTQAPLERIPPHPHATVNIVAYALMGTAVCALLVRGALPLVALIITVGASAGYLSLGYPYMPPVFLAMGVAVYSLASRWPIRRSASASVIALAIVIGGHIAATAGSGVLAQLTGWLTAASLWLLAPWAIGVVVGLHRETAARNRAEETRRWVDEERLRIVREVHDVVGHGLAAINMQAGVALHVLDRRPEQARPALETIKKSSKEALDELRGTLAVFRQPGDPGDADAPTRPTPGLSQLDTLISSTTESGLPVEVEIDGRLSGYVGADVGGSVSGNAGGDSAAGSAVAGDADFPAATLPAAVDTAAYRIIQESLTNVLRHGGQATARVRITREPGAVLIEVTDDGQARQPEEARTDSHAGGHGIAGMRERAAALGGTLEAGPRAEGGFRVRARLPAGESQS